MGGIPLYLFTEYLSDSARRERFQAACSAAMKEKSGGIGTLGEKTLHACLKYYFECDASRHEVKLGRYVADIAEPDGVIEIQTRQFYRLKDKLTFFLEQGEATVVYPVAAVKWVAWVSPETGEITKRRRSPRPGIPADVLPELYGIRTLLMHPGLHIHIPLLEVEEYRLLNGWSKNRKKGSARYERRPLDLLGEIRLQSSHDFASLLPEEMPSPFKTKDLAGAYRMSDNRARAALGTLLLSGAVSRVGKQGNALLYTRNGNM